VSIENNKALIRRWIAARNNSDLEAALACWADDTHEWLTPAFNQFTVGIPDIHVTIEELIAEGDKVVANLTLTGTHRGVWDDIPATGNAVTWNTTDIYTVTNGKIASLVRAADELAWLKQLGVTAMWQDKVIE
jgi:ketosteroid isomerase-like protein